MKKIIATLLMITSVSAIASPAHCLLTWAKSQGANIDKESSIVSKWSSGYSYGYFNNSNQLGTLRYKISLGYKSKISLDKVADGPWDCHCTAIKVMPADYYKVGGYVIGICAKV